MSIYKAHGMYQGLDCSEEADLVPVLKKTWKSSQKYTHTHAHACTHTHSEFFFKFLIPSFFQLLYLFGK